MDYYMDTEEKCFLKVLFFYKIDSQELFSILHSVNTLHSYISDTVLSLSLSLTGSRGKC